MEGLRDIKDIVEINEHSFALFIATLLFALLLLFLGLYLFKNRRGRRKKPTPRALAKEALEQLNFDNTKEVVYDFLEYGVLFIIEKNEEAFKKIEDALAPYKYKKEVPALEEQLKKDIKSFIKGVKV